MTVILVILYLGLGLLPCNWSDEELSSWEWLPPVWKNAILIVMWPIWPLWIFFYFALLIFYILKALAGLWTGKQNK